MPLAPPVQKLPAGHVIPAADDEPRGQKKPAAAVQGADAAAKNMFENLTVRNMVNRSVSCPRMTPHPTATMRKIAAENPNPYSWRVRRSVVAASACCGGVSRLCFACGLALRGRCSGLGALFRLRELQGLQCEPQKLQSEPQGLRYESQRLQYEPEG